MNLENFEYLKDTLKYTGFGDKLNEQLGKELGKGEPNFQLTVETEVNNKAFAAVLNFRKSDNTDMYFFNSYHATLQRKDGETVDQAFYLNKGKGVTAKEAFNLLDGRAVHKELTNKDGVEYKAWVQIDFEKRDKNNNHEMKQFHQNYGYDVKEAVTKLSIKEMDGGDKEKALLQSLQRGNVQSVTMDINGETRKMFIEANPQFKTVNVYDDKMQRLSKEQQIGIPASTIKKEVSPDVSAQKERNHKEVSGPDKGKEVKQNDKKKELKAGQKTEKSILPKKREGKNKGLGVS